MKENINSSGLAEVCEVISSHMGLHFPVERWDMLGRNLALAASEFGFEHFDEFTHWLLTTTLGKDQIKMLASFLTISESYFWREPPVFEALINFILPEFISSKNDNDRTIRIWSVGCSTGEEAYSLAIALHKTIPFLKDWNILILATDISPKALSKAKTGIYGQWSFRNCPPWLKKTYFNQLENGFFEIIPEIKKMVTFSNLNLAEAIYPSFVNNTHSMDLIFCRNVLMYMTDEWVSKISGSLSQSLHEDGWFVVASCELSSQLFPDFISVNFLGAVIYHKGKMEFPTSVVIPPFDAEPALPTPKIIHSKTNTGADFINSIPDTDTTSFVAHEADKIVIDSPHISEVKPVSVTDTDLNFKIRQLAGLGNLSQALALCEEEITADKLARDLYFLKASILQELNRPIEAITTLKQAIYIDPDFVMAHFVLGNLYLRQGNPKNAKRHYKNVLDLLQTYSDETVLPESEGLSVKYIREIIFANMKNE